MRNAIFYFLFIATAFTMVSCGDDDGGGVTPTAPAITAFTVTSPSAGVGIIDEASKAIEFSLPYGTDFSNVSGAVTATSGATVSPDLSAGVDFSAGAVEFTVTLDDQSTTYTVTGVEGANPLRVVMVGNTDFSDLHIEMQTAYQWGLDTYGEKAAYMKLTDLTADALETAEVIWWHEYDTVYAGRVISSEALAAKTVINDFYKGGGNLVLTTHSTQYLSELGRISSDFNPTGGGNGNPNANDPATPGYFNNPDDWGLSFENAEYDGGNNASSPLFEGMTTKSVTFDGLTYDAIMMIDGGSKRDAGYFWDVCCVTGIINQFDTNGDGTVDPATELDTNGDGVYDANDNQNARKEYFEQATSSVVRGSTEWDPSLNGIELMMLVEFLPAGDYQGTCIAFSQGGFEWYHNDGRTNTWAGNQQALIANSFSYLGVE